jgi:hypothetical protein
MIAQVSADRLAPILMVELDFQSGWVRAWTGYGDLVWNSNTYTGVGTLLSLTPIQENQGATTSEVTLVFTPHAALLSAALGEAHRGRRATIRFGVMVGQALVADPITMFQGLMEPMSLSDDGQTGRIELRVVNRFSRLGVTRERRLTDQEQRRRYSLDEGLSHVTAIAEKQITWSNMR